MDSVFENLDISVLKIYRIVQKIKNYEMREFGLKSVHVMCIYYLSGSDRGLSSGDLMRLTLEDKAAVSRAVAQLREKGYVDYDGTYHSPIRLTEQGREIAQAVLEKANRAVKAGSADFSAEEREKFHCSLIEISEKLKIYYQNLSKEV